MNKLLCTLSSTSDAAMTCAMFSKDQSSEKTFFVAKLFFQWM